MGTVYADVTLKNVVDVIGVQRGLLAEQDIRELKISAVVDTGAMTLVISEAVQEKLGLETRGFKQATLANNAKETCKIAEPVEIHWKDRSCVCQPWVIPGSDEVLLGVIPLEDMDLMVDPCKPELIGRHGEEAIGMLYKLAG